MCKKCAEENGTAVDEVVVERLISGDRVHATTAERTAAVVRLEGYGYSALVIAARLHTTTRTIERHRAKLRGL